MTGLEAPGTVAVLGAGTMGREIALVFARRGHRVVLWSRREETSRAALEWLAPSAASSAAVATSPEEAVAEAAVVVETIVEDLDTKTDLLRRVGLAAPAGALLTTNTSSLSITALSTALDDPGRLIGLHWFHPASAMPLVEIVLGASTRDDVLERTRVLATALSKESITVRSDVPGFVVNRLQYALMREALSLVDRGVVTAEDVDAAVSTTLAPRWCASGLFELMDLAGLDTVERVSQVILPALATETGVPALIAESIREGRLGRKSGEGFYRWDEERAERAAARRDAFLAVDALGQPSTSVPPTPDPSASDPDRSRIRP